MNRPVAVRRMPKLVGALALGVLCIVSTSGIAGATLIQDVPFIQTFGGSGLGAVNTVLTLQGATGVVTTESGSVAWDGSADVIIGDAGTGASQTLTRQAGLFGLTDASQLRIVFNGNETNGNLDVDITSLVVTIYNADGSVQFTSGAFGSTTGDIPDVDQGTGSSGFVFKLDAPQALLAGALDPTDRIGLAATIANIDNGPDTFYLLNGPGSPVPEPTTMLLWGTTMAGLGLARRRWRRRS